MPCAGNWLKATDAMPDDGFGSLAHNPPDKPVRTSKKLAITNLKKPPRTMKPLKRLRVNPKNPR